MANKISSATPEQWAQIDKIREWWLALQTQQQEEDQIEIAVGDMWADMGHEKPRVVIVDSPSQAVILGSVVQTISDQSGELRRALVSAKLNGMQEKDAAEVIWASLYKHLGPRFFKKRKLGDILPEHTPNDPLSLAAGKVILEVIFDPSKPDAKNPYPNLHEHLTRRPPRKTVPGLDEIVNAFVSSIVDKVQANVSRQPRYVSVWWQACAAWYEGAKLLGVQFDEHRYWLFRQWCLNVPMCVPYKGLVITSRRPKRIKWDRNRLHCEDGPAIEWLDGSRVWSIDGVRVDEQIVMTPESQTIEQIRHEENEEVRRIRIERYGWDRWLQVTGSTKLDSRTNDIEGTLESLYHSKDGHSVLICVCPSTARVYSLEVPPDTKSCEDAQAYLSSGLSKRIISAS